MMQSRSSAQRKAAPGVGNLWEAVATTASIPEFITEVSDPNAQYHRIETLGGTLFAGMYSDGRMRLATAQGKRFSGIVMKQKAVMADLGADDSFEMQIGVNLDAKLLLKVNGGPYDGQTLICEAV